MMTAQQQEWFRRHAIERMELSVKQAQDWVGFYKSYGPVESLTMWENTLLYRVSLLKAANDAANNTTSS